MSPTGKACASHSRFVVDGWSRARSAGEPRIREQVLAEYAQRLAAASAWQRFWLWRAIDREVEARLQKLAPRGALY